MLAGALRGPDLAVAVSPFAAQANQGLDPDLDADADEDSEAASPAEALEALDEFSSPLIRKFFQVGWHVLPLETLLFWPCSGVRRSYARASWLYGAAVWHRHCMIHI